MYHFPFSFLPPTFSHTPSLALSQIHDLCLHIHLSHCAFPFLQCMCFWTLISPIIYRYKSIGGSPKRLLEDTILSFCICILSQFQPDWSFYSSYLDALGIHSNRICLNLNVTKGWGTCDCSEMRMHVSQYTRNLRDSEVAKYIVWRGIYVHRMCWPRI